MTSCLDDLLELESAALVLSHKERVKCNLNAFSEDLLNKISTYKSDPSCNDSSSVLATLFNNAALVQFHAGEIERAEELCHHAISLYGALKDTSTCWLVSMIQPYIILGRVAAARGNCQKSIESYSNLASLFLDGTPLIIDGFAISSFEFKRILTEEPDIEKVIINVYVLDSIRAFLISKDYTGLIAFLDHFEPIAWLNDSAYRSSIAREAHARALIGLGRHNEALKILAALVEELNKQGNPQLALYTLISDIYRRRNKLEEARKVLDFVERHLARMISFKGSDLVAQQATYLLALGQYSIGEHESAHRNAMKAIEMVKALGDEVGTLKCLMLIYAISCEKFPHGSAEKISCSAELRMLAQKTAYRFERAAALLHLGCGLLGEEQEAGIDFIGESLALFSSLQLSSCEQWKRRSLETLSLLPCAYETIRACSSPGHSKPIVPQAIETVYDKFMRLDCDYIGAGSASEATALSAAS